MGGSFFAKRKGCGIFWLIMFTIFLPLVIIFVGNVLVGAFQFYLWQDLMKKPCCYPINAFIEAPFSSPKCPLRLFYYVLTALRVLFFIVVFAFYIVITLGLGTAFGVILIVPSYVIFLIVLCRIKIYWKKRTPLISKTDITQPLLVGKQEDA